MTESEIQNQIRAACNTGPGGSDLIGMHTITIQPEHVGCAVGVFLAIECKNKIGKLRPEQENFINFIQSARGIAGVARSTKDAHAIINDYKPCL